MNAGVVIFSNLIVCAIVYYFVSKRIYLSDFFNRETKCYFLKPVEERELTPFQKRIVEIRDGNYVIYNERFKLIEYGIVMPFVFLGMSWPFIYYMPNNIFGWCCLNVILIEWYEAIVVYLRMKFNKSLTLLDENFPYDLNYTSFALQFNRFAIVLIAMCVYSIIASNTLLAKVILIVLVVKMHVYIFMDKIDGYFGWNVLEPKKIKMLTNFEAIFFYITFLLILVSLALGPMNVFFY